MDRNKRGRQATQKVSGARQPGKKTYQKKVQGDKPTAPSKGLTAEQKAKKKRQTKWAKRRKDIQPVPNLFKGQKAPPLLSPPEIAAADLEDLPGIINIGRYDNIISEQYGIIRLYLKRILK